MGTAWTGQSRREAQTTSSQTAAPALPRGPQRGPSVTSLASGRAGENTCMEAPPLWVKCLLRRHTTRATGPALTFRGPVGEW
jgi:hypothetical protein